jgi:hypothetical protein
MPRGGIFIDPIVVLLTGYLNFLLITVGGLRRKRRRASDRRWKRLSF